LPKTDLGLQKSTTKTINPRLCRESIILAKKRFTVANSGVVGHGRALIGSRQRSLKFRFMKSCRRQFVRQFTLGSASAIVGAPWAATLLATLAGENSAIAATSGDLVLQLTSFPALLEPFGSVRVSVNPLSTGYPDGNFYPIVINRDDNNAFYAVSSNCPHRGCVVAPFNGYVIECPCHGSQFAIDGTVVSPPASTDLLKYAVSFDGVDTLRITVPNLGYSITKCVLVTGPNPRLQLDFPTLIKVSYEVRFRPTATSPWIVVPFATTVGGPVTNTVFTGNGSTATVFVERAAPAGFFSVAIVVQEV
jgi:Rieske Fe-S protein